MLFAPGTSNKDIAAAEKALAKQRNRGRGRGADITDTFIVRPPRNKKKPARKIRDRDQPAAAPMPIRLYAKGGMANCGASMKPNGAARGK